MWPSYTQPQVNSWEYNNWYPHYQQGMQPNWHPPLAPLAYPAGAPRTFSWYPNANQYAMGPFWNYPQQPCYVPHPQQRRGTAAPAFSQEEDSEEIPHKDKDVEEGILILSRTHNSRKEIVLCSRMHSHGNQELVFRSLQK